MQNIKFYRVKYGFGDDEFYSIPGEDLKNALIAQGSGGIFACEEGTIAGNNIISIMPDYNRVLGLNRDYKLTGEDYGLLGVALVKNHRTFLQDMKHEALESSQPKRLGA